MDIRQIRYFLRVAKLRSFTRAAEELCIAQPALSRQVKLLEEEFGVRLLHRHGRGVALTDAGAELEARSTGLVSAFDRLMYDMQGRARGSALHGSITLGVPISLSRMVTMPIMARCRSRLPGVAVRVVEGHSEMIADWLLTGRVELAILFGDHPRRTIATERLAQEEVAAVVAAGSPWADRDSFAAEELASLPLILPRRPHATWAMLDGAGIKPDRTISADTLVEILGHVFQGNGIALVARSGVELEMTAGQVRAVPIVTPSLQRVLVLGHATAVPLADAAGAVMPLIRAAFTELAHGGARGITLPETAAASR